MNYLQKTQWHGVYSYSVKDGKETRYRVDISRHYLGSYTDPVEAARNYDAVALHLFGKLAVTNFPDSTAKSPEEIRAGRVRKMKPCTTKKTRTQPETTAKRVMVQPIMRKGTLSTRTTTAKTSSGTSILQRQHPSEFARQKLVDIRTRGIEAFQGNNFDAALQEIERARTLLRLQANFEKAGQELVSFCETA